MPDAKNDKLSPTSAIWLLLALLLVAAVRLHGLAQAAFPDYDSTRNWQIVQEIAAGNWHNLFHHASPGFYLLYAPVALLQPDFHWYLYLNALVAVAAVGRLTAFVARHAQLPGPEVAGLALLMGTGTLLTFSGRDFTMGSVSLLVFAELLRAYYSRLQQPSAMALRQAAIWLAVGLCVNYKFLLTIPILLVFEWAQADGLWWRGGNWWRVAVLLLVPFLLLGAWATWQGGLPWYRWPATYAGILWPSVQNGAGRSGNLRLDLWYYPQFLLQFEAPLLWLGLLLGPAVFWREVRSWRQGITLPVYLLAWAWLFVGGMSLLLKAPRGLLFAYGLFAALGVLSLRHLLQQPAATGLLSVLARRVLLLSILGATLLANMRQIQQQIYRYTPTQYPAVVRWLQAHGQNQVASTVSNMLLPFADSANIRVHVITDENELPTLQKAGVRYAVVDGYRLVTGIRKFSGLEKLPTVAQFEEPMLLSPLLFLEHSEFTGLGYAETLRQQQVARQQGASLRIVRLPSP